tara:strand:+ start:2406 stop:3128 length:723 start_codon:yes stop_codon:yes gene_type:complete
MKNKIIIFKNIKFFDYEIESILKRIENGGYLVAPAASSLSKIYENSNYYSALKNSTITIFDSGLLCLLLRLFRGIKVKKLSGYLFLKKFLEQNLIYKKILTIDPNRLESKQNKKYLMRKKIKAFGYIAPYYKKNFKDLKLINYIKKIKPNYILINIAGEKQEILGLELNKIFTKIPIFCTGAAIGFLVCKSQKFILKGSQAPINDFIDKYYLGWLFRLLHSPIKHYRRFFQSLKLIKLFL